MTGKQSLSALIEAVEAGKLPEAVFHGSSSIRGHWAYTTGLNGEQRRWVYLAYNGSLDAAKALHDDLLSGWSPSIGQNVHHGYWFAHLLRAENGSVVGNYEGSAIDNPARAWLIAILKAYEAQQ